MQRRNGHDRTYPTSLVECIIAAINEVAPGQGAQVYWRAFEWFEQITNDRRLSDMARQLSLPLPLPPSPVQRPR
jgi:hypothetical protein